VVVLAILSALAISGLDHDPRWWGRVDSIDPNNPKVIEQAERLENAITTQLTTVRDQSDSKWAVAITQAQGNAWLAARLMDTIETHFGAQAWADELKEVRIEMHDEQLVLGARVGHAHGTMIVWARVQLELDSQGQLWAELSKAHLGTTPVPMWGVRALVDSGFVGSRLRIGKSAIGLGDGRVAELVGVRVRGGQLELVMDTHLAD